MMLRTLVLITVSAAALAGCGRRGALEDPGTDATALPSPSAPLRSAPPNAATAGELSTLDPGSPGAEEPAESAGEPVSAERRFILDPLL